MDDYDATSAEEDLEDAVADTGRGIRCPLCQWRPPATAAWVCSSVEHPEYFDTGCGTVWNTFLTRGLCPGCGHQWTWTGCLACHKWSRHADWYAGE